MAKISVDSAPPAALPRLFLQSAPWWGVAAGLLLAQAGGAALQSRWAPATLALVHVFALGVLGNAMFGSLLQFLPAAAGVRVRGGLAAGRALHALLNLGAACLAAGFLWTQPAALRLGAGLLATAFALLGALVLPGLCAACVRMIDAGPERRVLHAGLAAAVAAGLATAAIGAAMASRLSGLGGLPLLPWVDVHAGLGVVGWVLGLAAAVGAVVGPMFQGAQAPRPRWQWTWLAALLLVVGLGPACLVLEDRDALLRFGGAGCLGAFALAGLWRQWRAPRARNGWLVRAWRVGLAALLAGALVLARTGEAVLAGTLVLGIGFPWLVAGMQLEIVAFVGWIHLHRVVGRGVRLPPVQALATDADKAGVFALQGVASTLLLAAACWPGDATARAAGVALFAASALLGWRLHGIGRRCRGFRRQPRPARATGESHA